MELTDILIDLSNSKAALMAADQTIRKLNGKCMRKNLAIMGLVWFGLTACKMLGKSENKLKEAEERARDAEADLASTKALLREEPRGMNNTDVCCDGKATITKKSV